MNCIIRQLAEVFLITRNKKKNLNNPSPPKTIFAKYALLGPWTGSRKCVTIKISTRQEEPVGNSFIECLCDKNIFKGSSINFIKLHCALLHDKPIKPGSIWISNQGLIVFDTSPPCTGRSCLSEQRRRESESQPAAEKWVASQSSFASVLVAAQDTLSHGKKGV